MKALQNEQSIFNPDNLKAKPKKSFYTSITGMDKIIDVTSDYVFKGIFSDEARTKDFLENVLIGKEKILPEGTQIESLDYLPTEYIQNKMPEDAKKTVFDLQIRTNNGIFIIEMQKNASQDYLKRVEFYSAISYSHQQIKDKDFKTTMKDYTNALPIVTIAVINEKIFDAKVPCVSYHVNMERKTQEQHMKALSYVFIELGKFGHPKYDQSNITANEKDWLAFLKTQDLNHTYNNNQVNNAVKYVQNIRDHKYDEYIRALIAEMAAQKELESAENRGVIRGRKEGREEGEHKKAIEMAKLMLADKEPIEKIIRYTNLSRSEVENLK
jgi:predicted transposase/invertase (TIGR01784 family)